MRFSTLLIVLVPAVCLAQSPAGTPQKASPAKPAATSSSSGQSATPAKPAAAAAPDSGKVVLVIGKEKITAAEFGAMLELLPEQMKVQARGPGKRAFAEQIIRLRLLSGEARRRGLDKDPKVINQINFQTANVLAGALFQKLSAEKAGDAEAVRKFYDEHKNEYEIVRARHILIRFQGSPVPLGKDKPDLKDMDALIKANQIKKRLEAGESFEALAKAESDDTGSGANGGDLGEFRHGMMVPPFEAVAFALKEGQLSDPVKTQFGYHIIKVESHRVRPFEEVKEEVGRRVGPDYAVKATDEMRKTANVYLDDSFFPPPPPPGTPVPPPAPVR